MVTNPTYELVMLEPTQGYFESLRHTMTGLQAASRYGCLLSPYLFEPKTCSTPPPPQYLRDTPTGEPSLPHIVKSLDRSQRSAFNSAVTKEVALIQGPPGTGKTFTSNAILQSLVDTREQCSSSPPILVAAQTNHAVDQLLKKFIADRGSENIIRMGSRGSDDMKDFVLAQRIQTSKFRGQSIGHFKAQLNKIVTGLEESGVQHLGEVDASILKGYGLLSGAQYDSLVDDEWESADNNESNTLLTWLGDSYVPDPSSPEPERKEASRGPKRRGPKIRFIPLKQPPPAHGNEEYARYLLETESDLYDIQPEKRRDVYDYLITKLHGFQNPQSGVIELLASYNETCRAMKNVRVMNRTEFIQGGFEVVACTTTGLLKYQNIIAGFRPRVLLMEEAAEVREADTIAACLRFPSLEHLILLGDHQQLQPHANLHELSRDPYRINISMFERLIKVGSAHKTLLEQRRMIPRLRQIVQLFYPNVIDSPCIAKRCQNVPGLREPLWWFQHDWEEARAQISFDSASIENDMEARMIVLFIQYLVVVQNIRPERITVLTFYNGQVRLIKGELSRNKVLASHAPTTEWSVRTVDGFQGEENDFIILSLVRGPNGVPGFLASDNRAIVSLSRARLGLYIFGHRDVLLSTTKSRETWSAVLNDMKKNTGRFLPLRVDDEDIRVRGLDDWKRALKKTNSASSGEESEKPEVMTPEASAATSTVTSHSETLVVMQDSSTSEPQAENDLISLSDAVSVPLSQQILEAMGSISLETPALQMQEEKEDLLIQFSDDEDPFEGNDTTVSSEPLIDLLT